MNRCKNCLMPESLTGSDFDQDGTCRWCQVGFPNYHPRGEKEFLEITERLRKKDEKLKCVVGISGGKDSCYVLAQLKIKYDCDVTAFIYTHGGLADFALENARLICKQFDVPLHERALPGHTHLESFKKFFLVWLNDEEMLSAAMTCVACKHLFILGSQLAKEVGAKIVIWSDSPLETPPFIPAQGTNQVTSKSKGVLNLGFMLCNILMKNHPFRNAFFSDLNTHIFGCLAFRTSTGYLQLRYPGILQLSYFDYFDWNAKTIKQFLLNHTKWSLPPEIECSWHSDCVMDVFKEYMMQKMIGASYTDAYLSNQIRCGLIDRTEAYNKLITSKKYYEKQIYSALEKLGLGNVRDKINPAVFQVD